MPDHARTRLEEFMSQRGIVYRLARLVQGEIRRVGSAHKLRTRIIRACEAAGMTEKINVHVLKGLQSAPERTHLTLPQLVALHLYFAGRDEGLDRIPLFSRQRLLDALQQEREITVLIAAKALVERQTHYTRWDARALNTVKNLLLRPGHDTLRDGGWGPRIEEVDVLLGPEGNDRQYASERWHQLITEDRRTLVSIGSPRASLASELLLSEMFGLRPFAAEPIALFDPRIPFQFVWPQSPEFPVASSFALSAGHLEETAPGVAAQIRDQHASALACAGRELLEVPGSRRTGWNSFGVICAQRRPQGHLWIVLGGLSGPATLAAAEVLGQIEPEPPPGRPSRPAPVVWGLVEAHLNEERPAAGRGDTRNLTRSRLLRTAIHPDCVAHGTEPPPSPRC